jgi:N-acetylglucosamine kinase-like BadF-type ATPase
MLIAGTGSVAWGRGAAGEVRVGGWGQQLGDEGSGYAIGLAAVRAIVRADDGRAAPTMLRAAILEHLRLEAPVELIPWAASATKSEFAALVPLVGRCAGQGDETAREILDEAAADLEAHVRGILAKSGPWLSRPGLLLYGGVIGPGGTLRDALVGRLASQPVDVLQDDVDAATGAARLALASLGPRGR